MPNHVVKASVQKKGTSWEIVWNATSDTQLGLPVVQIKMTLPEKKVWYKNPRKKVLKKDAEKIADLVTAVLDYLLEE